MNAFSKSSNFIFMASVITSVIFTTSCSSISKATNAVSNVADKSTSIAEKSVSKLIPSRIPLATVNEDAFQALPTGKERASAYQKKLDSKRYANLKASKAAAKAEAAASTAARAAYNSNIQLPDYIDASDGGGLLPSLQQ